jgi:hypothetical protein
VPNRGFVEHTFIIRNGGDSVLHITAVYPSCGCTKASLADSLILPGHSTSLLIRLDESGHRPGGFSKQVGINSNSRDTSRSVITFYGRLVEDSTFGPQKYVIETSRRAKSVKE